MKKKQSACGHAEPRTGNPRRGISVSSRWGCPPSPRLRRGRAVARVDRASGGGGPRRLCERKTPVDPESDTPVLAADCLAERPIGHRLVCLRDLAVSPAARTGLPVCVLVARHAGSRTRRQRRHHSCPGVDDVGPPVGGLLGLGGFPRFLALPTVCWLGAGDLVLVSLCTIGAALSLFQIAGLASALVLPLLWLRIYRSPPSAESSCRSNGTRCCSKRVSSRWSRALDAGSPAAAGGLVARDITLADLVVTVPSDVSLGRRQADERRSDVAGADGRRRSLRDAAAADAARGTPTTCRPGSSSFPQPLC